MPDFFTVAVLFAPLALWAWAEYMAANHPDWPANCTPFEGEAQRWKAGRKKQVQEGVPKAEVLPPIPAGMTDKQFEAWLNASEPVEVAREVARHMAQKDETLVEFDLAEGIANAELSIEQRRQRMERLRREVEERKKKNKT